ncbi:MAG: AraC family transcriptional regulator [Cyclobacteriaceae bacterium]|nr:AraC family transcriptional regulator [Cyclobacteriaceae bacterium]
MGYRMDFFAVFILLGLVQAVFLTLFFFSKEHRLRQYNVLYGWLLIAIIACELEIFLMYTGYIDHILHLVDFSEPFALLIGPFLFLYVRSLARGPVNRKLVIAHTAFPIIYSLLLIPFLVSSIDIKYNAWINAYHPGSPLKDVVYNYDPWMFLVTEWHTELVLISLAFYLMLSGGVIIQAFSKKKESFWFPQSLSLRTLRNGVMQIACFTIFILVVKLMNKNDTGDHLFATFGALMIYATSFSVMRGSGFFKQASLNEQQKYKGSSLTPNQQQALIDKLNSLMKAEKPYMRSDFSLPELAQELSVSVHVLSQAINDGLGKSFFELIAAYRVEEAKKLLKEQMNIKVEEIAEQVGYNSKSSFNTAFKKNTGMTPSEFRQQ